MADSFEDSDSCHHCLNRLNCAFLGLIPAKGLTVDSESCGRYDP